jgi:type IV pilus assembly protein PilB
VVLELGYVTDEQMRQTIRRNQGELRIGDLLGGLAISPRRKWTAPWPAGPGGAQAEAGDILIQHKFLADDKLTEILACSYGLPVLELTAKEPDPGSDGARAGGVYERTASSLRHADGGSVASPL